ncbi:DUF6020 family protein [Eupransor demetentiae]|uniref:Glycosyltransferase RgtA/B/C/D-like domain-containing protein n=1 Tax=Eupransor demetentiae TaxID=3109584 RepID=A0ABM9N3F6_9LACO|nr:hypothetical protein R54876_GBNLAHCA_00227 [Lactobacillaceae bacterium LMG 33000]
MLNNIRSLTVWQKLAVTLIAVLLGFFNSFGRAYHDINGSIFTAGQGRYFVFWFGWTVLFALAMLVLLAYFNQPVEHLEHAAPTRLEEILQPLQSQRFIAKLLLVVWGIALLPFFPVISGWDFVAQVREMTTVRTTLPVENIYNIYPIAHYLTEQTTGMWSNQHGAILTALYGLPMKYSWLAFHSYLPAFILLGGLHFAFAIAVYSYSLAYFNRQISQSWIKIASLLLVLLNPAIFIFSTISLSKNPLFSSSSVLVLTLLFQLYQQKGRVDAKWKYLLFIGVLIGCIAVKWALPLYGVMALVLLVLYFREAAGSILFAMLLPVVILKVTTMALIGQGILIADDPIEAKGIQTQQIARFVKYDRQALTSVQSQQLDQLFDLDNLAHLYDPNITDPVKSSGYAKFSDPTALGYRYQTVNKSDWQPFNGIWLSLLQKRPDIYLDAFLSKLTGYFDLRSISANDMFATMVPDVIGNGYGSLQAGSSTLYNNPVRAHSIKAYNAVFDRPIIGFFLHGNFWIVLFLLVLPVFLATWRRLALALPVLLEIAIAALSPVNNSERYALGIIVIMPFILLMAAKLRPKEE